MSSPRDYLVSLDSTRAYRFAIVLMVVSSVGFSLNGLIIRSLEATTPWQILFWRGIGVFVGQLTILIWIHRSRLPGEFFGIGRWGIVAGLLNGCSPAGFFFALTHTTVANVMFLLSAMPFVSALAARLVLGERLHRYTLIAIPVAFTGILIMVGGSILVGAWLGNLLALVTVLCFSCYVVILRYSQGRNMQPTPVLGAVVAAVLGTLVTGGDLMIPVHDLVLCFILGCVITGLGHQMFLKAAEILPAGEVTFLMLLEFVLSPLWVWAFIGETPRATTLIGGGVVLATVTGWAFARMRESKHQ